MKHVKSKGNASTEMRMVTILRREGIKGWRRHLKMFGVPDFAWTKLKVVLFVDGCFWHACPECSHPTPKTNSDFWSRKISGNAARDVLVDRHYTEAGWTVLRVWEHELRGDPAPVTARLREALGMGPRPVSVLDRLIAELVRPELSRYTVVRTARRDAEAGDLESAVARLRADADKLRAVRPEIVELISD